LKNKSATEKQKHTNDNFSYSQLSLHLCLFFLTVCISRVWERTRAREENSHFLLAFIHFVFIILLLFLQKNFILYVKILNVVLLCVSLYFIVNIFLKFPHAWANLISYFPLNRIIHRFKVRWRRQTSKKNLFTKFFFPIFHVLLFVKLCKSLEILNKTESFFSSNPCNNSYY